MQTIFSGLFMKDNNIYPEFELTKKLIGFTFKIYNDLKYGLKEKAYQTAFEGLLVENKINYQREKYGKITYHGTTISKYYLDFSVE